jgi:hypothetical protein
MTTQLRDTTLETTDGIPSKEIFAMTYPMPDQIRDILNTCAGILLRCFILSLVLLLFWFVFFLLAGDLGYWIHSHWFDLTRHDFDLINYCGMALVKALNVTFFLIPYVAIRLMLHGTNGKT